MTVHPSIESKGVILNVQMPGHKVSEDKVEQAKKDIDTLDELIREHDAIYLLFDSREARWLPSVISAAYDKVSKAHADVFLDCSRV